MTTILGIESTAHTFGIGIVRTKGLNNILSYLILYENK